MFPGSDVYATKVNVIGGHAGTTILPLLSQVHKHIYMYIYIHIYFHTYLYMYTYMYTSMYICRCIPHH
jgi:hypothetical protein